MATTPQLLNRISTAFNRQELALNALGFNADLQGTQPPSELEWIAVRAERVADVLEAQANATTPPASPALDTGETPAVDTADEIDTAPVVAVDTPDQGDLVNQSDSDLVAKVQPTSGSTSIRRASSNTQGR